MKQLPLHQHLTPRQKSILLFITKLPQISNKDILKKLRAKFGDIARITLIRDLNYLKEQKYISRIGEGRRMRYILCEDHATQKNSNGIPENLKWIFWDTDVGKLSLTTHSTYIVERVLEWGNTEAVRWLRRQYSKETLLHILDISRTISHKSWHFWKLMLSNSNTPISCTQKSWEERQKMAWKY